mmetsp:Transcript_80285/g.222040  ORF Transcript_80285/g.222040 Transcript_80285/m.222040 type:complete len:234 (+) Transcript_80285:744-1445(+)
MYRVHSPKRHILIPDSTNQPELVWDRLLLPRAPMHIATVACPVVLQLARPDKETLKFLEQNCVLDLHKLLRWELHQAILEHQGRRQSAEVLDGRAMALLCGHLQRRLAVPSEPLRICVVLLHEASQHVKGTMKRRLVQHGVSPGFWKHVCELGACVQASVHTVPLSHPGIIEHLVSLLLEVDALLGAVQHKEMPNDWKPVIIQAAHCNLKRRLAISSGLLPIRFPLDELLENL